MKSLVKVVLPKPIRQKDEPPKKRGRPKKKNLSLTTQMKNPANLIAKLVAAAKLENDKESSEEETQEETQEELKKKLKKTQNPCSSQ